MKFDMGSQTLGTLTRQTSGSTDELTGLVRALVEASAPLEGKFNGSGRMAFDNFKGRVDEVTNDLNRSLAALNVGQSEMDLASQTGDMEFSDNASRSTGAASFDAARFSASR